MKVLLINGSPHAKGCTYTALSQVEEALNQDGIETEVFQIGNGAIHGCIGCNGCAGLGHCVFNADPLNEALGKMKTADGLVVGSPVYFASPNGSILSFLDRMFYSGKAYCVHKPAAAVVSARRAGTTAALDAMQKYFQLAQMPVVSSCYWNMVHGNTPQEVMQDLEGLQVMRTLGHNMAWLLRCIEAGRKAGCEAPKGEEKIQTNFIR